MGISLKHSADQLESPALAAVQLRVQLPQSEEAERGFRVVVPGEEVLVSGNEVDSPLVLHLDPPGELLYFVLW